MIHIGDSKGKGVKIPIFHTGIFGQSGTGKTKLLKYMMSQAQKEGYRVLIFDSKVAGPEFEGIGSKVPFYIQESTDPDVFRSLIEGMRTKGRGNMERFRGGFIEVCGDAADFREIGRRLHGKLNDPKIRGYTKSMYYEINYDYMKLMELIRNSRFTSVITKLKSPISVMPTWELPNLALQGLVVRSVVEKLLGTEKRLIFVVDEAPNFVNQRKFNPAKDALQLLDSQGRKPEVFGWYSGQTLTGFDKANMKNLWYWILGREMENNEAKDVYDTMNSKIVSLTQIKTLKVREFIAVGPDFTKLITVPFFDDKDLAFAKVETSFEEDWSDLIPRIEQLERHLKVI